MANVTAYKVLITIWKNITSYALGADAPFAPILPNVLNTALLVTMWSQFFKKHQKLPLKVSYQAERSALLLPPGAHISCSSGPLCWQRNVPEWSSSGGSSVTRPTLGWRRAPEGRAGEWVKPSPWPLGVNVTACTAGSPGTWLLVCSSTTRGARRGWKASGCGCCL